MLSGIGIICFSATYLVAFLLELFRSSSKSRGIGLGYFLALILGLVAHTAFLYHHQVALESGKIVNSVQGFFFLAAWGIVCLVLYLGCVYPKFAFGLFLLPVALGLIAGGTFWANTTPYSPHSVGQLWRSLHGISLLLAVLSSLFGFISGLMYFAQQRRLKKKITGTNLLRLPTLEWSQVSARNAIGFSSLMLFIGIFSGLLLNHLLRLEGSKSVPMFDPLVTGTLLLFVFMLAFLGVLLVYRPAREGRRIALLTVLSFLFLITLLFYALFSGNAHWGQNREAVSASQSFLKPEACPPEA